VFPVGALLPCACIGCVTRHHAMCVVCAVMSVCRCQPRLPATPEVSDAVVLLHSARFSAGGRRRHCLRRCLAVVVSWPSLLLVIHRTCPWLPWRYAVLRCVVSCRVVSCRVVSCRVVSCCSILWM
jgi:hypothetical protein